jgi:hypothetical protein
VGLVIDAGIWAGDIVTSEGDLDGRASAEALLRPEINLYEGDAYPMLSGVDPYGNTVFNQLQLPKVIEEIERMIEALGGPKPISPLGKLLDLARRAERVHTYLVFVGD